MFAPHGTCGDGPAIHALVSAVTVDMLSGRRLETAVTIRRRSAIHTALFIGIVLMKAVKALGTARAKFT